MTEENCKIGTYLLLISLFSQFEFVFVYFTESMVSIIFLYQDVTLKIISFSQQGSRAICILAANGGISNVTLRQPNSSGGTLTYEVGTFSYWSFVSCHGRTTLLSIRHSTML